MSICVIVADGSKARILHAESGYSPLQDENDFIAGILLDGDFWDPRRVRKSLETISGLYA